MADEEVEEEELKHDARDAVQDEEIKTTTVEKPLAPPKYEVRPKLGEKFKTQAVKDIILTSMQEQLMGRQYRADMAPKWSKTISNGIRQRIMNELDMKRYKIVVLTTLIETRGAGIKCAQRCIWDPETDDYVDSTYRSNTLFCHSVVYGIYMY